MSDIVALAQTCQIKKFEGYVVICVDVEHDETVRTVSDLKPGEPLTVAAMISGRESVDRIVAALYAALADTEREGERIVDGNVVALPQRERQDEGDPGTAE